MIQKLIKKNRVWVARLNRFTGRMFEAKDREEARVWVKQQTGWTKYTLRESKAGEKKMHKK